MALPEKTIESAVEELKKSPAEFQRLVEYYACLTYPERFKGLVPQGRNLSGVTVKGWPDIYSRSPDSDGRIDVVEATHSPDWARHLQDDLGKAEAFGAKKMSGFLFVAWANEPSPLSDHQQNNPRYELLRSCRERLVALDIPPENIDFVFKKQLVRSLAQPRFAAVLADVLKLRGDSSPFKEVSRTKEIFGTSGGYDVFAPSKEEYESDLVHRADITDEVEKRLSSSGWAWLRGRGAAGKTVLAIHVGRGYEKRSLPAYYLDLAKPDVSVSDTLNAITTRADDGVLFIVDNVHLNQSFARDCFDHWQSVSVGSHLLLIGRDTTTFDFRGTALPLDDLRAEALTLKVTQKDLEGVFLRLARRALPSNDPVPSPPQEVLQGWHKLFGGDLIAFGAAVAQRLPRLVLSDWTIQAQDAARYVRRRYLAEAGDAERLNLLRLAVLAELEMDVPEEAVELGKIEPFLQSGLVHFVERGRDTRYGYYRLVHAGLGDLLLTAADYSDASLKQFKSEQLSYIACRSPHTGSQISSRLEANKRTPEAASILRKIVELEDGLEKILVAFSLQSLPLNSARLIRLGVMSEDELDRKLVSLISEITLSALRTPVQILVTALEYAKQKLPTLYASVTLELQRPEAIKTLGETARQSPLHFLATFLRYSRQEMRGVWNGLKTALEQPEAVKALGETAQRTPLGDLTTFLRYARQELPAMHASVKAALERPDGLTALGDTALRTPLDGLATFIRYAGQELPVISQALTDRLTAPANIDFLADVACQTPLDSLVHFAQAVPFGATVILAIDKDKWEKCRMGSTSERPGYIPAIAKIFQRLGRPELAEAPALSVIQSAATQYWASSEIGPHHISYVLRLGRAAEPEAVLNFIRCVATPAWLKERYERSPSYGIASSLFSTWAYHDEAVLAPFRTPALTARVRRDLTYIRKMTPEYLSGALELLGVSALTGVRLGSINVRWPDTNRINEAVSLVPPEATTVSYISIQIWLGLRVMAVMRPDSVRIAAPLGDHILALWKETTGHTDKQNKLNEWMIDWLERCARAGWVLINDRRKK